MNNPVIQTRHAKIYLGSNLEILPTLADNSIDAIVTDPPYELGFMSKAWDSTGIAYSVELWRECLRVLKPGGHLLAFGGTRTWHRLAVAIEDAGFEIRDSIAWLYGSGFPKSHNISKAIDKMHGAEREVVGRNPNHRDTSQRTDSNPMGQAIGAKYITASATDDAKKWDGWGTALKPAHEPIVVARKPLIGTVAENVLTYETGGLNVDACRIGTTVETWPATRSFTSGISSGYTDGIEKGETQSTGEAPAGRWPANIILDETTAKLLDEQSGISKSQGGTNPIKKSMFNLGSETLQPSGGFGDVGGASRFFYIAKASKRDRNEGLDELPEVRHADRNATDGVGGDNPRNRTNKAKQNFHPTVKPTLLMQYLIRLVTPENGVVLDPFAGSGSTGKAAILEKKQFIGIEITAEYLPIIQGRIEHAEQQLEAKADDLFE